MNEHMRIKSKKGKKGILLDLTGLTGVCVDELMPPCLFVSINTSKSRLDFGCVAYQADNPIIQQNIVSHRRKPTLIANMNMHRYISANVTINKNVILIYDLPFEKRRISGKVIRAPPPCRA